MARHKPFSKHRWMMSQKVEKHRLQSHHPDIPSLEKDFLDEYQPVIDALQAYLPEESHILEIGCGATCASKLIPAAKHTYLDPLLDDYRRAYPGGLPEGCYITSMAEDIPRDDQSFDAIFCLDALTNMQNPELVLHEVERLLKPEGTFIISLTLWPPLLARLFYWVASIVPALSYQGRLYCYSRKGLINTLQRHFSITREMPLNGDRSIFFPWRKQAFLCHHRPTPSHDE